MSKDTENLIWLGTFEAVCYRKSTWTPTEKDFWDSPKFKQYIGQELDSFILMDSNKKEHKMFWPAWSIDLDFWDFGLVETKFTKIKR